MKTKSSRFDIIARFSFVMIVFWERKRTFRADFAFAKKIQKMRQQCHVPPVADLIGDGTIVECVFDSAGDDRTAKLYS